LKIGEDDVIDSKIVIQDITAEHAFQTAVSLDEKDDLVGAQFYYELAANLGHADATFKLARLYDFRGKTLDFDKARALYEKAISLGSIKAINNLGCMYEEGKGVPKDVDRAISLYNEGIDHLDTNAMVNMAFLNEERGNFLEAKRLYELAIEHGNIRAISNLALIYFFGKDGETENWILAQDKLQLGYAQKDADSTYLLSFLYYDVYGLTPSPEKAKELYRDAIEYGDCASLYAMGVITNDDGNRVEAKSFFERYMKHKDTQIDENLASCYAMLAKICIAEPPKDWKSWKKGKGYADKAIDLIATLKLKDPETPAPQLMEDTLNAALDVKISFHSECEHLLGESIKTNEWKGDIVFNLQ
jgi:TPR repeat protein